MASSSLPLVSPVDQRSVSPKTIVAEDIDLVTKLDAVTISSSTGGAAPSSASACRGASAPAIRDTDADQGSPTFCTSPLDPRSSEFKPARSSQDAAPSALDPVDRHLSAPEPDHLQPAQGNAPVSPFRPAHNTASTSSISTATTSTTPSNSRHSVSPFTPSSGYAWGVGTGNQASVYSPPSTQFSDSDVFSPPASKPAVPALPPLRLPHNDVSPKSGLNSRFLMVTNVPFAVDGDLIKKMIINIAPFKAIIVKHLKTKGWFIVAFFDSRDATAVLERLSSYAVRLAPHIPPVNLNAVSVSPDVVRQITGHCDEFDEVWKNSNSLLSVKVLSDSHIGADKMRDYLCRFGDIQSFDGVPGRSESYLVDYYDTRIAGEVANLLNNQPCDGGVLGVQFAAEDPFQSEPMRDIRFQPSPTSYTLGSAAYNPTSNVSALAPPVHYDAYYDRNSLASPPGLSAPPVLSAGWHRPSSAQDGRTSDRNDERSTLQSAYLPDWPPVSAPGSSQHFANHEAPPHLASLNRRMNDPIALQALLNNMEVAARTRRTSFNPPVALPVPWSGQRRESNNQAVPAENRVSPERLLAGEDTRTTVMIKDVPNKLSRQQLVDILREVVPGEFDFVYLRFDFNNRCNVGYAFVNFTSVRALHTFYQAKVGKRWNMFSSEKVLQISYANIQGKTALVNKFRNSQVMDVTEEWRPQIFYSSGALRGEPEPFPEPDHPSARNQRVNARLGFLSGAAPYDSGEYAYTSGSPFGGGGGGGL